METDILRDLSPVLDQVVNTGILVYMDVNCEEEKHGLIYTDLEHLGQMFQIKNENIPQFTSKL